MALTVTTTATDEVLTTRARVKSELGITGTSDDGLFDDLLKMASAGVERYCNRPFLREIYSETVPGYGTNYLTVSRTPIRVLTDIYDGTTSSTSDAVTSTEYSIANRDAGTIYREGGWRWTAKEGWNLTDYHVPMSEHPRFTVLYEAGYLLTTSTGARTLPYDVEKATIETIKSWYLRRADNADVDSQRVGDLAVTYRSEPGANGALPITATRLLEPWRRFA